MKFLRKSCCYSKSTSNSVNIMWMFRTWNPTTQSTRRNPAENYQILSNLLILHEYEMIYLWKELYIVNTSCSGLGMDKIDDFSSGFDIFTINLKSLSFIFIWIFQNDISPRNLLFSGRRYYCSSVRLPSMTLIQWGKKWLIQNNKGDYWTSHLMSEFELPPPLKK